MKADPTHGRRSDPAQRIAMALDRDTAASYRGAIEDALKEFGDGKSPSSVGLFGFEAGVHVIAALAHAERVVVVEDDPTLLQMLREIPVQLREDQRLLFIAAGRDEIALEDPVDLAVFAVSSPWFLFDRDAPNADTLAARVLSEGGQMIPRRSTHLFELVGDGPDGFAPKSPAIARLEDLRGPRPILSESKHFLTVEYGTEQSARPEIEDTIIVKPLFGGTLTGLRLTTLVELTQNRILRAGRQSGGSIFVPLESSIDVVAGHPVNLWLRYAVGTGTMRVKARSVVVPPRAPETWRDGDVGRTFVDDIQTMIGRVDASGRGADLDKIVEYSLDPHGDVSRLTALFWTIDEEFRPPLRDIVAKMRRSASAIGVAPADETIYELMLEAYHGLRATKSGG